MTVSELIEKLRQFDPDAKVVSYGFDESEYVDIDAPVEIKVANSAIPGITSYHEPDASNERAHDHKEFVAVLIKH